MTAIDIAAEPAGRQAVLPRVAVVEDQTRLREQLVWQLRAFDIEPLVARSGYEAIRVITESQPDLIFLDGLLPEMHGFDVARFIRQMQGDGYAPRIVLLTAIYKNVRYQNDAKLRYGIDEYLLKPVSEEAIRGAIERSMRNN